MIGDDLKVTDGERAGAWIRPRLSGKFGAVTLQVPKGFEAYARVFHPAWDANGNPVRWHEVADALGTTVHREMQWAALIGSPDPCRSAGSKWSGQPPMIGEIDNAGLDSLCEILTAHTADPARCFFGLCVIQSWEEQFTAVELKHPYLKLPMGRDHIVLEGRLSAADQIVRDWGKQTSAVFTFSEGDGPPPEIDPAQWRVREGPNLIWPDDQSWLVASEVDFDSTLVGGDASLIEAIVGCPKLEAWAVEPTDSLACDADKVNAAPEAAP